MERKTEEVTRDDAQLLYDAFTASPIGIALENIEGQPFFVNPALCSMLGFSEEEMRTRHCVDFSPKEDAERDWTLFQQLRSGTIDHYQLEKRFFRRNGSLMWGRLSISLLNHTSPIVIAMVEDITDKKIAQEHAEALVTDMSRKLIEAQERERTLIARELHDEIFSNSVCWLLNSSNCNNNLKAFLNCKVKSGNCGHELRKSPSVSKAYHMNCTPLNWNISAWSPQLRVGAENLLNSAN